MLTRTKIRRRRLMGSIAFSVLSLFASNEVGAWYDPSDLTTLYQDAAGTTPVTAVEQPVGLVLDKSKGAVGTNGAKRVNLLAYTEQFDNAAWTKFNSTITANAATDPLGGNTADALFETSATAGHSVYSDTLTVVVGATYKLGWYVKANGRNYAFLRATLGGTNNAVVIDLSTGTATSATGSPANISSVSAGNGWYFVSFTSTVTLNSTSELSVICSNDGVYANRSYTGDPTKGVLIWGADFRLASEASTAPTPYQRITADWASTMSGSHLSQSTAAARPVLSARVNLLTRTEEFDNAAWTKEGGTITADGAISPIGTTTAERMTTNGTANTLKSVYQAHSLSAISYTVSVCVKDNGSTSRDFQIFVATNSLTVTVGTTYNFDTDTLTTQADATPFSGISASRTSLGSGWYRITLNFTVASAQTVRFYIAAPYVAAKAGDFYIWGADLRPANAGVGLPAYQRVGAATAGSSTAAGNADYDTTGFPLYLKFDGTDDFLVSSTINPGSVYKAQIFAGVRKLSDAASAILAEYGTDAANVNGSLALFAPAGSGSNKFQFTERGSIAIPAFTTSTSYNAPTTNVISGIGDISGDTATLRINGAQIVQETGDQGTGNFAALSLYVGSRAGTSLRLNGHIYQLLVRFSATNMDAATITATETWVNGKTKAY